MRLWRLREMQNTNAPADIVLNFDQLIHVISPLLVMIATLLTAGARAIWKKLNMLQAQIDILTKHQNKMISLHEINHPGQEID